MTDHSFLHLRYQIYRSVVSISLYYELLLGYVIFDPDTSHTTMQLHVKEGEFASLK